VRAHGLQDGVERVGDGGLEVPGVHLAGLVVLLERLVGSVLDGALCAIYSVRCQKSLHG
jgi:hypothetical protein